MLVFKHGKYRHKEHKQWAVCLAKILHVGYDLGGQASKFHVYLLSLGAF